MRRTAIVAAVVVITTVLPMTVAFATPPTGELKYTDYARVQSVDSASVPIQPGTNLAMGLYSIAPGGDTGWRSLPGTSVLAVSKGKLMLHGADCGTKDYAAGQAATVPAGTYSVHNAGNEPLEFFGAFFAQAPDAPRPLAEGPTAASPANCSGVKAAGVGPTGVSVNSPAVGKLGASFYNVNATLDIKSGRDVLAAHYDVSPGWSSGWISHLPAINIVQSGTLSYAEAKDGKCDTSEVYSAGQAFYHPAHRHLAFNEGTEHVLLTTVYFNLPHETPLPVVGNQATAVDFSQAPPADCPRLR